MSNIDYYSKYKKYKRKYLLLQYGGDTNFLFKPIQKLFTDKLDSSLKDYPEIIRIFKSFDINNGDKFIEELKKNNHIKDFITKLITIESVPFMYKPAYKLFMAAVNHYINEQVNVIIDNLKPLLVYLLKFYKEQNK
jgi:FMN phosphatase YigB (HAD superfamily)